MKSPAPSIKKFSNAAIWNFGTYFIKMIVSIIASALLLRLLGKSFFGTYYLVLSILSYISLLCQYNFTAALLRFIPEFKKNNDTKGIKIFLLKLLSIQLSFWLFLLGIVFYFGKSLSSFYNVNIYDYMVLGMVSLFITIAVQMAEAVLTSFYEVKVQAIGISFASFCYIFFIYIFLQTGRNDILICFWALICKDLIILFIYGSKLKLIISKSLIRKQKTKITTKRLFNFATPSLITNFVNQLVLSQSETLYLGHYSTQSDVGVYSVGYSFPQKFITVIPTILRNILHSAITDYYLENSDNLKKMTVLYYKFLFLFIAPFSVGGALILDKAVILIYGPEMEVAGQIAQILFIVHTFILFSNPFVFVMRTLEDMWIGFKISLFSATISIVFNIILISKFGLIGAVISTSITLFINAVVRLKVYKTKYSFVDIPWATIRKYYMSTICFFLFFPLKEYIDNIPSLFVILILMCLAWIATAKYFKIIDKDMISFIKKIPNPYIKKIIYFYE